MKDFNDTYEDAPDGFMDDNEYYDDLYENSPHECCPKCGRMYDDIGFDLQYCKVCGWDAEKKEWAESLEPSDDDYMNGDADILTGEWI